MCALFLPAFSHHTTLIQINDLTRLECLKKYCRNVVVQCMTFNCNLSEMVQLNAIEKDFGGLSAPTFTFRDENIKTKIDFIHLTSTNVYLLRNSQFATLRYAMAFVQLFSCDVSIFNRCNVILSSFNQWRK